MSIAPTESSGGHAASRSWTAAVLLAAAVLRLAMTVYADRHPERFDYPDSRRYVLLACNIAAGNGAIESPWNRTGTDPLYSYFIAPALFGRDADPADALDWFRNWREEPLESRAWAAPACRWARLINMAFSLAGVAAVMAVAGRIAGAGAALAAGLITALDPISVYFCALVLTESVYVGMFWCAVWLLMLMRDRPRLRLAAAAGALLGAGALTRSAGMLLGFAMPVVAVAGVRATAARRLVLVLVGTAATAAVIAPQAIRNYRLLGRFVPVHTSLGATLLDSLGPWADGGPGMQYIQWPPTPPQADEYERDRIYRDWVYDWARHHPGNVARLAWNKLRRTWSIMVNAPGFESPLYRAVGWLTVAPVYVLAAIGAWRLRRRATLLAVLLAPALYVTVLHMVFVGSVRYRLPAMPGLFILAGVALAALARSARGLGTTPDQADRD